MHVTLPTEKVALHWLRERHREPNSLDDLETLVVGFPKSTEENVSRDTMALLVSFIGARASPTLKSMALRDSTVMRRGLPGLIGGRVDLFTIPYRFVSDRFCRTILSLSQEAESPTLHHSVDTSSSGCGSNTTIAPIEYQGLLSGPLDENSE